MSVDVAKTVANAAANASQGLVCTNAEPTPPTRKQWTLHGRPLLAGDMLEFTFPDGHTALVCVRPDKEGHRWIYLDFHLHGLGFCRLMSDSEDASHLRWPDEPAAESAAEPAPASLEGGAS